MANRFIGGVLSSRPQANTPFSSRASTGTYFDSAGVMRTAPINQPRLNYNLVGGAWTQPSVLIEPASTNALLYSQDFSNANWELSSQNSVLTANSITAPDGTVTASTISNNSSSGYHRFYQPLNSFTQRTSYSFSVFLKYKDHQYVSIGLTDNSYYRSQIVVNLVAGTIAQNYIDAYSPSDTLSSTITSVGNGWYRLTGVYTPAIAIVTNLYWLGLLQQNSTFSSSGYVGTGTGFYMWGAQAEINLLGATSYIPTTSAAVTRAADVVGPGTSGIYSLEDRQTSTAVDDQATVTSFTSTGSTTWTAPADVNSVEVLVVAGGGGGGSANTSNTRGGGGGGAGGLIYNTSYPVTPGQTYPIVVGTGGAGGAYLGSRGSTGKDSQFGNLIAGGGGFGGSATTSAAGSGGNGGAGGGGGYADVASISGQAIVGQGYPGGSCAAGGNGVAGASGGGAGGPGLAGGATYLSGTTSGSGLKFNITGSSVTYATGGGGGGGSGDNGGTATANTGNGGPGGGNPSGWTGGSGIVVIKYQRTPKQLTSTSNASIVVQKFSTTNLWTVPVGVTSVEALVVAGGGGGANIFGGGGAGGVVYNSALAVTPGSTYTIGVGTGGLGGAAATNTPNNGRNGFGSGIGTGTELITNGSNFTVTTGWSATTATLSVPQTGVFRILPNASVNGTASQSITTVNGTTYVAVVRVINDITKNFRLRIGTTQVGAEITDFFTSYTNDSSDNGTSGVGFYSVTFTATGSTTWINMQIGGGTQQATDISYISVRQASLPAVGGGFGGAQAVGNAGGSGGGGGDWSAGAYAGGAGTAGQGNAGGAGAGVDGHGGGGGGAGSAGIKGVTNLGGQGGTGIAYSISGNLEYYGGGGGGGVYTGVYTTAVAAQGGLGGGGAGGRNTGSSGGNSGNAGSSNTGGGGGGGTRTSQSVAGGNGGSGVVILRYRVPQLATFQDSGAWTCPAGVTSVQALIVAGGGSGSIGGGGGGGGAGGLIYDNSIPVTPGVTYPIVVGQGGAGQAGGSDVNGTAGQNSSFANLIAIGGGQGARNGFAGQTGGSGGGGYGTGAVGSGTYSQGNSGGTGVTDAVTYTNGGGGGGAGSSGLAAIATQGGQGGAGLAFTISGTSTFYAGGGAGGCQNAGGTAQVGGVGGGGGNRGAPNSSGYPGTQNTGGGGGGGSYNNGAVTSGSGGSGVVILRWSGA